jgi:hypothetical protein
VSLLSETFSKENVFKDRDGKERRGKPGRDELHEAGSTEWKHDDRANCHVIHGHFPPKKYRRAFPDALYITLYRHPVQQFASLYHFWLDRPVNPERPIHPHRRILRSERLSLEEFSRLHLERESIERDAAEFRTEYFDFTGITEEFDLSVRLLRSAHIPGLATATKSRRVNPKKKKGDPYILDDRLSDSLCDLLAPKIRLYNEAAERFRSDCERAGISGSE